MLLRSAVFNVTRQSVTTWKLEDSVDDFKKMSFFNFGYLAHVIGVFLCPFLNISHPQLWRSCRLVAHSIDYVVLDLTTSATRLGLLLIFGLLTVFCFLWVANYHILVIYRAQINDSVQELSLNERSQFYLYPRKSSSKRYIRPRSRVEAHHEHMIYTCLISWELAAWFSMTWVMGIRFVVSLLFVKAVSYRNFGLSCLMLGIAASISSEDLSQEQKIAQSILDSLSKHSSPTKSSFHLLSETLSWMLNNNKENTKQLF